MTLILTAASPLYVVQCSDRLLTMAAGVDARAVDPVANKTILYRATDAIAVIGYSGLAYVGGMPTDEYLAALLWGATLARGPDGLRPANKSGRRPNHWNMGQAEHALEAALAGATFDGHFVGLTIAGWRRRGGRIAPFVVEIERPAGSRSCLVTRSPRRFVRGADFFLHSIGVDIEAGVVMGRFTPHRRPSGIAASAATTEEALSNAIKDMAARDARVGGDVLSVVLPHPKLAPGAAFFRAARDWPARIEAPGRRVAVAHADHTPWIITPNLMAPPSAQVGDIIYDLGGYEVVVRGAPPRGGLLGLQTSVARPRLSELRRRFTDALPRDV